MWEQDETVDKERLPSPAQRHFLWWDVAGCWAKYGWWFYRALKDYLCACTLAICCLWYLNRQLAVCASRVAIPLGLRVGSCFGDSCLMGWTLSPE